ESARPHRDRPAVPGLRGRGDRRRQPDGRSRTVARGLCRRAAAILDPDRDQPDGPAVELYADDPGRAGPGGGVARYRETLHSSETGMSRRLEGRVALVVGAARGIGAGIAERFVEEGARVMIADTEGEAGAATAKRLGGRFITIDISRKSEAERAVAETIAVFGGLDIVVQNAGIYPWS